MEKQNCTVFRRTKYSIQRSSLAFRLEKSILIISLIQVHFISSSCDSKNLNLSPLCHLDSNQNAFLWADDAAGLYSAIETTPEYIADIPDTKRPNYATLDTLLTTYKVIPYYILCINLYMLDGGVEYFSTKDKDLAVVNFYFGNPTTMGE